MQFRRLINLNSQLVLFSFQTIMPRAFLTGYKIIYFLDCCKFGIGVVGGGTWFMRWSFFYRKYFTTEDEVTA